MSKERRTRGAGRLALVLTLAFALPGCENVSAPERIERAKDLLDAGQVREGAIELRAALQELPDHPEARWLLGRLNLKLGQGEAAEKELTRAQELGVPRETLLADLAEAWLLMGKPERVLGETEHAAGLSAQDRARIHVSRGRARLGGNVTRESLEKAKGEFEAAQRAVPDWPRAKAGLALLALYGDDRALAHKLLDEALAADAQLAEAWSLKGDIARIEGDAQAAEAAYGRAIAAQVFPVQDLLKRALTRAYLHDLQGAKQDIADLKGRIPGSPLVPYAQGVISLQENDLASAQTSFEAALSIDGNYVPALEYLGAIHLRNGNREQAVSYLTRALAVRPTSVNTRRMLALSHLRNGDVVQAQEVIGPALRLAPDDPEVVDLAATVLLRQGRDEEAVALIRRALEKGGPGSDLRFGRTLLQYGEAGQAEELLGQAVQTTPGDESASTLLVLAHLRAGKIDAARDAAVALRDAKPDAAAPWNLLGFVERRAGNETSARTAYEEAWKRAPGDPAAGLDLATRALDAQRPDEALRLTDEVLAKHPDHPGAVLMRVRVLTVLGRMAEVGGTLRALKQAHPDQAMPRYFLANEWLVKGRPTEAMDELRPALERNPGDPTLLFAMARAELMLGQTGNAAANLKRALERQPKWPEARVLYASTLLDLGQADAAREQIRATLAEDAQYRSARIVETRLESGHGDPRRAAQLLAELRKASPDDAELLVLEGGIAARDGRHKDAARAYQAAAKQASGDSSLVRTVANAQWNARDFDAALATLNTRLETQPDDVAARFDRASHFMMLNRSDEAIADLQRVVQESPDFAPARNNLAWMLRASDPRTALTHAQRAAELMPNDLPVQDTWAVLRVETGDVEGGLRLLETLVEREPKSPVFAWHLAWALDRAGRGGEALGVLNRLLADPRPFAERAEAEALRNKLRGAGKG